MFRFKELIELWRTANSLTQALNDSHEMLERTGEMFEHSVKSLRQSDTADMHVDIRKMDEAINRYERRVRHKVLKHLAITGGTNMIPGLILTSIVIDIERIGDYTKNIKDLAVAHPTRLKCGKIRRRHFQDREGCRGDIRKDPPHTGNLRRRGGPGADGRSLVDSEEV